MGTSGGPPATRFFDPLLMMAMVFGRRAPSLAIWGRDAMTIQRSRLFTIYALAVRSVRQLWYEVCEGRSGGARQLGSISRTWA